VVGSYSFGVAVFVDTPTENHFGPPSTSFSRMEGRQITDRFYTGGPVLCGGGTGTSDQQGEICSDQSLGRLGAAGWRALRSSIEAQCSATGDMGND